MRTGWHHYCFFCALACAIFRLTSAATNCSVTNTDTIKEVTCYVSENVPPNTLVYNATEDSTFSDPSNLEFQVFPSGFRSAFMEHFVVNSNVEPWALNNGELRTRGEFDREQMFGALSSTENGRDTITWRPLLVITGGPNYVGIQLHIVVVDVNDNTPTFPMANTTIEKEEGDSRNVNFSRFLDAAVDTDEQHNSVQNYTLQNDYNGLFTLVVRVGPIGDAVRLESTSPLDHENRSMYEFLVIARDGGNQTGTLNVTLRVLDVNDNRPVVGMTSYTVAVVENLDSGYPVIDINATDADSGSFGTLKYSMTVQNNDGSDVTSDNIFAINQTTGEIQTNAVLDHEQVTQYHLMVMIRDGGDPPNTANVNVRVDVTDANDNPPDVRIDLNELTGGRVRENTPVGNSIATMTVSDPDEGVNSMFTVGDLIDLDVENGSQIELREKTTTTWDLVLASSLDRETREHYNLQITVTDLGSPPLNTTRNFSFSLHDINDNAPTFNVSYQESVSEGTAINHTIVRGIRAYDRDIGTNAMIEYSLMNNSAEFQYQHLFSIHQTTGDLMVAGSLDREAVSELDVLVIAKDKGTPRLSGNTTVHLVLTDVNDNQPMFVPDTASQVTVQENLSLRNIYTFSASDPDLPPYANVTYSIMRTNFFRINATTGQLFTTQQLNREDIPVHHLQIGASDNLLSPRYINFSVVVGDVNDVTPRFNISVYMESIPENATINTVVTTLIVEDPDLDNGLQFTIVSGNNEGKFSVNTRGEVIVEASLDRETTESYTLMVGVTDGAGNNATSQARVEITVSDINDHNPQFSQSLYTFYVTEESEASVDIGTVSAVSDDAGQNAIVSYRITYGNDDGYFTINSTNGIVTAGPGIDRESNERFRLKVTAQDGGHPPLYNSTTVIVIVRDINDNRPIFNETNVTITLREDHSLMQPFYIAIAEDADEDGNANTTYSIVSRTYGDFNINPNTGALSLVSTLDFENATSVVVVIKSTDRDQPHFTDLLYLTISVEDIDDRLPRFQPDFPTSVRVNESASPGHVILTFQAIISPPSLASEFEYSISDHMGDFTLSNVNNEALIEVISLDREVRSRYSLNVTITNTIANLRNSKLLEVIVTDTNDNPPTFNMLEYTFEVMENSVGADVGTVEADDSDDGENSMINFSFQDESDQFHINPETGRIQTLVSLDYDTISSHNLMVLATDMGNPSRSTSATVSISVIDVNDNPPEFSLSQEYEFSVLEDASIGTVVGTITATDIDSGSFGALTYTIQAGDPRNRFTIIQEGRNRMITVSAALDREMVEEYILLISVSDNNGIPHSHIIQENFTITLLDVNDNAPVFGDTQVYAATVPENKEAHSVANISAIDADTDARSVVSYSLGSGNYKDAFSINPSSGEIHAVKLLDYETNTFYPLEVIAYDGGSPARRSVQVFNITVGNVNDNTPQFALPFYKFSVREGSSSTSVTMPVQAVDDDLGVMGEVMYRIVSQVPSTDFEIDSTSGVITAVRPLNYERHSQYELVVEAIDMDLNEANRRRSDTLVHIVVENINDNRPSFLNLPHTIRLSESVSINTIAYVALAVDADSDTLQFSIAGGNQDNKFTMNSQTGEVFVSSSLDREVISSYELTIRVTDGSMADSRVLTIVVEDVNDNTPAFNLSSYTIYVSEGANVSDVAEKINATDKDKGLNAQLEYSLVEPPEYFSIDSTSGNLRLLTPLDRENSSKPNPITLQVKVTDRGIINRNSNISSIEVIVKDVNDNPPVFTRPMYRFTIPRNFGAGVTFGVVNVTDADEETNAQHLFDITLSPQGLGQFDLDQTSGELSLSSALRNDSLPLYWIRVRARDHSHESFASVEIVVTDPNDTPPSFPQEEYPIDLPESVEAPRLVLSLSATDSDSGRNGEITYEFAEAQSHFTINQSSGDIELTDSLDHERKSIFTLLVYAVNSNGRNASTVVNINVLDVNDNRPQFQGLPTSLTISEVSYTGLEILHVVATDVDSGSFGEVSYSLITEAARSQFSIDNVTGIVTNLVELTAGTIHTLEFEATDGGGENRRRTITLTVADHSSQSPDFGREAISLMVSENYPINTVFHQFNVSSQLTSPASIQYRVSNFTDEVFALNQATGELMLTNSLDFEEVESYHFIIESFQEVSQTRYSTYLEVVILVRDVNDNAPVFRENYIVVTDIRESISMNQMITDVHADDADSGRNSQVSYEITEGNVRGVFSIAPTNGQIVVVGSLDRETINAYRLVVTATDDGEPRQSATVVVDIGISDDNDVTPSFRNATYVFRVSENSTLDSSVGVVSAVDPDLTSLLLRYFISSLTASLNGVPVTDIPLTPFQVNQSTGEIQLNHNLNRAQVDKYELQVDVLDGIHTNSTSVTILVQDANNNRPVFNRDGAIHSVTIPELSGVATPVFQFTVTDADFGRNGIVHYRLGDDWPLGQFDIDAVTGVVTLLRAAPMYQPSRNGLWETGTVIASDMGDIPMTSSITVTVNLRDVNNHPPTLSPQYTDDVFSIADVGTEISLNVTAGDQDQGANAKVSYYISHTQGPISVPFSIDPTTGRITVSGKLTPGSEVFTVIAINEDPDPFATNFILSSTATVVIRVNRMNRYTPQFNQSVYQGMVLESEDVGTNIVQVYATDNDEDTTISYSIQSSEAVPFAINANGLLSVNGTLDREVTNMYSLTIVAKDDGVPPKSTTAMVQINIIDVNDNKPTFMQGVFEASVTENVPRGTEVTTITAMDIDLLENAAIRYNLNDTSTFNINTQGGRIYTVGSIDREAVAIYYLQISATDSGNPVQSSSAVVLVTVDGVNEFEPMFNDSQETFFEIPSGLVAGSVVGRLFAYDKDQGKEGELKFTFVKYYGDHDPNNYFYINSSGYIILNVSAQEMRSSSSSGRKKRQTGDTTDVTQIRTTVKVEDSGAGFSSDRLEITLSVPNSYIPQSPTAEEDPNDSPIVVVIAAVVIAVVIIVIIVIIIGCVFYHCRHRSRKLKLYSPSALSDADSTRPSIVSFTTSNANGIVHNDARAETAGTRQTTVPEAGHAQVSTTSDSEPASGIFGDDESESVSGMQSRARANNPEHVSPNGRHRSPQHSRPPPISRSTSDLAAVVNGHNPNGFLRRTDDEEAHPYTRDQLIAIYAANANLLTNSPSQDSIHMFGSEGGGEADGDIDMDNYIFAKFAGGLDSADEESVVGMNNDAYTVSSRGRSSIASRSSGGGIDEGPEDLWRGSRQGFRPHRVTDVIDEMQAAVLSQDSLSQSKEKRKPKPPHTMQFQETSFTKKPSTSSSYTRHTGSMQNVRYQDHHVGNSQYEGYDGRRSSKSHYASSGAIYPLSYSSRASELTLPPYRAGEAPPPYVTELSPPLRAVNPTEMRRDSQSSDSDSSEYPPNQAGTSYGPQPISPQPSLPTTNSTMSLDNPIFQSPYSKHYKMAKGAMPPPHSGSIPQINMYNAGSVHGSSIGQGLDRQRYNVNNGTR